MKKKKRPLLIPFERDSPPSPLSLLKNASRRDSSSRQRYPLRHAPPLALQGPAPWEEEDLGLGCPCCCCSGAGSSRLVFVVAAAATAAAANPGRRHSLFFFFFFFFEGRGFSRLQEQGRCRPLPSLTAAAAAGETRKAAAFFFSFRSSCSLCFSSSSSNNSFSSSSAPFRSSRSPYAP